MRHDHQVGPPCLNWLKSKIRKCHKIEHWKVFAVLRIVAGSEITTKVQGDTIMSSLRSSNDFQSFMNSSFISLEYIFRIILRMTFPLLDFSEEILQILWLRTLLWCFFNLSLLTAWNFYREFSYELVIIARLPRYRPSFISLDLSSSWKSIHF